ncbi:SMP-30/gluconolactonase/LRE family protein [Frondihabitans australicus]|uniref:Gluconolactonase n=1 Tax=Frondihabitans australicus TaxID=386892 RepID=A0A495IKX9_9MICO|nr:SMP-30/gluconolactonase/LRE family protein [Frondihabitans australicus]RKR76662.1 gluconolactonase [Frondihabitans australicus]
MNAPDPDLAGLVSHGLIPPGAEPERVSTGCIWSEGPVWIPELLAVRWSDIRTNRIMQWSWESGDTVVYDADPQFTNGRTLDLDGSVLQCSHGRRRVERDRGGEVTAIATQWQGHRLNSPNDIVVTRDGAIWFTDPDYGITQPDEGHAGELEYGDHWVFRVAPGSATPESDPVPVVTDCVRPNGLAFSPDESTLYIADSGDGAQRIVAYDISPATPAAATTGEGDQGAGSAAPTVGPPRLFATPRPGTPDGIRVDVDGNVWSSSAAGVQVYSPEGELLGGIPVPEVNSNLCWGGPDGTTLFMTASTSLFRIPTLTRDAHQRW